MTHIERFGPFKLGQKIIIPGHVVEFKVDSKGQNFYIWTMLSKKSFDAHYWIASGDTPLRGDFYLRSTVIGVVAYHLMRVRDGGVRKGPRNGQVEAKDEESNVDHNESDQQEVLVEDSNPTVDPDNSSDEVGQSVPCEEGEPEES